jgi:transposase
MQKIPSESRLPPQKLDTIWGIFMERKVKYDYAFKLECVKLIRKVLFLQLCICWKKRIEIKPSQMDWVYKYYGAIGLLPGRIKVIQAF